MDRDAGRGVPGVLVTFVPADPSGPGLPVAVTSDDGRWETSSPARGADSLRGTFRVEAPGSLPYESDTVTIRAFDRGGAEELGRWTAEPFFAFIGELMFPDRKARQANVTFTRVGGAATDPEQVNLRADRFGRFLLQLDLLEVDAVVGDLVVRHEDLPRAFTLSDIRMPFKYRDEALPLDRVLRIGPSLEYVGRLWRRRAGDRVPAPGVDMEFRRIGGIEVFPSLLRSTTVDWGGFSLVLRTYEEGEVTGELRGFLPPSGEPVVLDTLTLATFDTEELRLAGEWAFGPQINYQAGVRTSSGEPLPGIAVAFVRTGGVPAEPDSVGALTDEDGLFSIQMHVEDAGTVLGELRIALPDGGGTVRIPDVQVEAREDDALHFLGWFEP